MMCVYKEAKNCIPFSCVHRSRSLCVRERQISAENGHVKKIWFRVSNVSKHKEQPVKTILFHVSIWSPVGNLFLTASQTMKEYIGVLWVNQMYGHNYKKLKLFLIINILKFLTKIYTNLKMESVTLASPISAMCPPLS